jgi:hypothetical protein
VLTGTATAASSSVIFTCAHGSTARACGVEAEREVYPAAAPEPCTG